MQSARFAKPQPASFRWLGAVLAIVLTLTACVTTRADVAADLVLLERNFSDLIRKDATPDVFDDTRRVDGLLELYLQGPPHKSSPTRIFALYGVPDQPVRSANLGTGRMPAVVLVHGGGGTAYAEWVRKWNNAGFAAISIAVEGQTDIPDDNGVGGRWAHNPFGGPPRTGIYGDWAEPIGDEWMFHAVYASIQANNFLRHRPDVDPEHIGIVGISWGGVIAATTIGFDDRFAFAIPVYGSGQLTTINNQYRRALLDNTEYPELWEPTNRLLRYKRPTLWLTGRAENNFYLPAQAATYSAVGGEASISIKPDMRHSHPAGWNEPEPYVYAAELVRSGQTPFAPEPNTATNDNVCAAQFRVAGNLTPVSASVHVTSESGPDPATEWTVLDAMIEVRGDDNAIVTARCSGLPDNATYWFVNLAMTHPQSPVPVITSSRLRSTAGRKIKDKVD
jgi:dienelactone hydrolase